METEIPLYYHCFVNEIRFIQILCLKVIQK